MSKTSEAPISLFNFSKLYRQTSLKIRKEFLHNKNRRSLSLLGGLGSVGLPRLTRMFHHLPLHALHRLSMLSRQIVEPKIVKAYNTRRAPILARFVHSVGSGAVARP